MRLGHSRNNTTRVLINKRNMRSSVAKEQLVLPITNENCSHCEYCLPMRSIYVIAIHVYAQLDINKARRDSNVTRSQNQITCIWKFIKFRVQNRMTLSRGRMTSPVNDVLNARWSSGPFEGLSVMIIKCLHHFNPTRKNSLIHESLIRISRFRRCDLCFLGFKRCFKRSWRGNLSFSELRVFFGFFMLLRFWKANSEKTKFWD